MTPIDPNLAGYSEAAATVFTWLADKVLGGAKKALGWGWERAQWAAAQDRYNEQIIKQYGWIRIFGQTTPKPLRGVFTDVHLLDRPTAQRRFDPDALREQLWEQDRSLPFRLGERLPADQLLRRGSKFLILGKPGAGKTTFLKHLAVREAQRGKWGACLGKIPIFVPLKQFAESDKTLFDFIVAQFAACHFPDAAPFVEPLLKEGKALVLFDGLDEVTKSVKARDNRRGQVTEQIEQFARQYDGCHIIITCRIAATEFTFDPAFIYLELADFAPDQVEAFVRNWFWDSDDPDRSAGLAKRMLAEWKRPEHAGIRDLGRSPLLLTLLCLNYAEALSFPVRRVEIYQEALDALLRKWDALRQIQRGSLYKNLSLGRKQQMFSRIAYNGFLEDKILFPQADLESGFKAYLAHVPEAPDAIDIDAGALLAEIVEQHGIFAEQARGLFSFAHLAFQEYYAARYLVENPAADALHPLMARVTDERWQEVFLLTASLLPDATPFLSALETALHRLIIPRPRLVTWLRWIDAQAAASRSAYRQPAIRAYYTFALAHELELELDLDLDLDLDSAGNLAFDLDFAIAFASGLGYRRAYALARGRDPGRGRARDRASDLVIAQEIARRLGDVSLAEALSSLALPSADMPQATWDRFAAQLDEIIDANREFQRYLQLETETVALIKAAGAPQPLDAADVDALAQYCRAARLFYDCLQLSYAPDRRAFEDRILLPPPLN